MRYLILFFTFQLLNFSFGQERATIPSNIEYKQLQKKAAKKAIRELRTGVLLVRLNFNEKEIAYFEKYQNHTEANKIRTKNLQSNSAIIEAFTKNFDFCPVYFFSMSDSRKIVEGKLDSVIYYNASCVADSSIRPKASTYLIAEFGAIEQDTMYYYKGSLPDASKSDGKNNNSYYGGDKNPISALVIRNRDFYQLREPFPYYVNYAPHGSIARRYNIPVGKLNKKLKFYSGSVEE